LQLKKYHSTRHAFPFRLLFFIFLPCILSCGDNWISVSDPDKMDATAQNELSQMLSASGEDLVKIDDSAVLQRSLWVKEYYKSNQYKLVWSEAAVAGAKADTLIDLIKNAHLLGLLPDGYHCSSITSLKIEIDKDSLSKGIRRKPKMWAKFDLLLTDALLSMMRDLHEGTRSVDTLYGKHLKPKDSVFYYNYFRQVMKVGSLKEGLAELEPQTEGYKSLKEALVKFIDSADLSKSYTYLRYPYKDSSAFVDSLIIRLKEGGWLDSMTRKVDSALLAKTIIKIQDDYDLGRDGKPGRRLIGFLNRTDKEVLRTIYLNLDRHRQLQHVLPDDYIGVNLPGFYLYVKENNRNLLYSRVVVGKPSTRTPILNSYLTDIVTYPEWTIPNGIIAKEILPGLRRNSSYLARRGYKLLGKGGQSVNPHAVNWHKYSGTIPYRVVQGSGDNNALGVLKFNFQNPYSVYMHDTNQRYLFGNDNRSLSHGCVRVQEWEKLAHYVIARDNAISRRGTAVEGIDSLNAWLSRKENHILQLKGRIPLFFTYITAEGKDGKLVLHEDIYGEDQGLRHFYAL